ncbi:MAG TPA: hypothetical protein VLE51_03450 [Candidatus Saccharimonadales bacterium]|nr:hypothetical protein [Candidatus Saccharimonadales bacterium]
MSTPEAAHSDDNPDRSSNVTRLNLGSPESVQRSQDRLQVRFTLLPISDHEYIDGQAAEDGVEDDQIVHEAILCYKFFREQLAAGRSHLILDENGALQNVNWDQSERPPAI